MDVAEENPANALGVRCEHPMQRFAVGEEHGPVDPIAIHC